MTTLEQILKYADYIGKEPDKPQDIHVKNAVKIALRMAYEAGMEFQQQQSSEQWMSKSITPEIGRCLVLKDNNNYCVADYSESGGFDSNDEVFDIYNFDSWRYLHTELE